MFESSLWARRKNNDQTDVIPFEPAKDPERPKIGIALGGGAARGWAHIGVVKALTSAGYDPEIISGTSMGAVVGGCYAVDGLDQLERFACNLSKRRIFGMLDVNFAGSSLISGNKLSKLLEDGMGDTRIEDLQSKFVAIATELNTGHEIWLSKGSLVKALRASYALPGIFKPVQVHGRWLVDGALVNPVPVSVCRASGARLVIAVNLNTDFFAKGTVVRSHDDYHGSDDDMPEDDGFEISNGNALKRMLRRQLVSDDGGAPGVTAVMINSYNIIQDRIARSRLAGDPPDITIGPRLGHIGLFDFHRAKEAIEIGEEAAERALEEIDRAVQALA